MKTATKMIPLISAGTGAFILLLLLVFYPDPLVVVGFLVGLFLAISNFIFLTKIVVKIIDENYKRKSFLALLFIAKLALIGGVLVLSFKVFQLNVMGFALGYACLFPAIMFQQLKNQKA